MEYKGYEIRVEVDIIGIYTIGNDEKLDREIIKDILDDGRYYWIKDNDESQRIYYSIDECKDAIDELEKEETNG